jgi:hypothetical protein
MTSAIAELAIVPYIGTSAPNWPLTASHVLLVRKCRPKVWNASRPPHAFDRKMPQSWMSTSKAAAAVPCSNSASPRRPPLSGRDERIGGKAII